MSLLASIQTLVQSWQRQGVSCPPMALSHVRRTATAYGVQLPPDFEHLYCAANGTPDLYPNYLDDNYCSFLPVECLRTDQREWLIITAEAAVRQQIGVTVFADYMHRSWEYGFIADTNQQTYQIGIMPGAGEFKVLTTSLAKFLQWYVTDADILCDYSHPFTVLGRSAIS